MMINKASQTSAKTSDQATFVAAENLNCQPRPKATYRKPALRRLGFLRSVAGSDPFMA